MLVVGNSFHFFDDELRNVHAGRQQDGRRPKVDYLQHQAALEAWMNRWRRKMYQQAATRTAALSFDPRGVQFDVGKNHVTRVGEILRGAGGHDEP